MRSSSVVADGNVVGRSVSRDGVSGSLSVSGMPVWRLCLGFRFLGFEAVELEWEERSSVT